MTTKPTHTYIIARKLDDGSGRLEYWADAGWTLEKTAARIYRTVQAADKTQATRDHRLLFITE